MRLRRPSPVDSGTSHSTYLVVGVLRLRYASVATRNSCRSLSSPPCPKYTFSIQAGRARPSPVKLHGGDGLGRELIRSEYFLGDAIGIGIVTGVRVVINRQTSWQQGCMETYGFPSR